MKNADRDEQRRLHALVSPYFNAEEAEPYTPRGYPDVPLIEVVAVPDADADEASALSDLTVHLVRLLHWMRQPAPGSVVAGWDETLQDGKSDGTGIASGYFEELLSVTLANIEALHVLLTTPRRRFFGPASNLTADLPEAATAAHYRAIIEASATFVWLANAENDQETRRRIVRLLEKQRESLDTVDLSMREAVSEALDSFVANARRRWFYTADGTPRERNIKQNEKLPGFEEQVRRAFEGEAAVRAWKRFSNAAHGSVLWSQLILQRPADVEAEPGDFWDVMSARRDREINVGTVHAVVRAMFAEAARILEPKGGPA
ncbi:hypothetical protein AB1K56_03235 [Microbacterium sp. BWR-S6Y]|uniref:hypothetical protein n=1 Tax=Microbacterium sp. BWR-S6Y TaxID=3232073 RepID=UPI0035287BBA